MSFNGSGVFQRLYNWVNDAAGGIKIRADRMDNEMNGFATGLSSCITKDGQTTVTANLPMATYRHTGVGNAAARTDYASFGQVQDGKAAWVDGGGTADAITAAYSIPITALVDGQLCYVRATAANATTTPTFSPSSLTARTIVKNGGVALVAGDIIGDGHELILRYDLVNTQWELMNPSQSAEFLDSTFKIKDNADTTKQIAFQASGITTGTTRTFTAPDASGTLALTSNNLGAFAATTSAQLAGVVSDETGSGALVFANTPTLVTPVLGVASATSINFGVSPLDSYIERQAFTPTLEGTSTAGAGTYSIQTGSYTRIGNMIFFNLTMQWTAHTGTGNMRIAGLPVVSSSDHTPNLYYENITSPANSVVQLLSSSGTSTILFISRVNATGTSAPLAMDTVGYVCVSGSYLI
jgi:hypothetical protein